ncbi:MAG: serine/threonine protein kinase [Moorea sp. SIOASIH]|uniref:serine/threonine-protein kinase n=1 Tax=Moorena sp. SIOASIH TaxID=2607817 RepID=UPI0013B66FC1|nr:serine/threonine-protein kinase [Moorena sp. SIOASIH]NEO38606.1 serine/threonine protein kinase [Moorena sp. SIOASIH]
MEIFCTRPGCPNPHNYFDDLDNRTTLTTTEQRYCNSCGMPLIVASRYIPSQLLRKGGFGAAFLARDRYTPTLRQCVVKQFQPSGRISQRELQTAHRLFEREATVLEKLGRRHPQIPDLYAYFPLTVPSLKPGKQDQFFYLVQEYIDGQNLEEELNTLGAFSEAKAIEVLTEILKVLQFVHDNGSIHRDIKPSNIMRDRNGLLYLLDFGAVKQQVNPGSTGARSTGIYSIGFAPPEQMTGSQIYPSTDLYALAVTVMVLMTGREPNELYEPVTHEWNWRSYIQISNELESIFNRLLMPMPNQRFQSAQEVLDAINSLNIAQTTPQTPHGSVLPVSPPSRPHTRGPQTHSPLSKPLRPNFSLLEVLGAAAFTGFEGALLFIAATAFAKVMSSNPLGMLLWGMSLGGLIYAQYRRFIEKIDLVIIGGISLGLLILFPVLRVQQSIQLVIIISVLAAAAAIALTALFRLVYQLLSRIL